MTLLSHWLSKNYFKPNNKIKNDFCEKILVAKRLTPQG
jgi:hypothetical protein